jgi:hypothetical protein
MSCEAKLTSPLLPAECYQTVIDMLPQLGFEIIRRREIAWLIQAQKNIHGRGLQLNIQCRPSVPTQVIISCQDFGDEAVEKRVAVELREAIAERLGKGI